MEYIDNLMNVKSLIFVWSKSFCWWQTARSYKLVEENKEEGDLLFPLCRPIRHEVEVSQSKGADGVFVLYSERKVLELNLEILPE
jgi:hypothetical protein